MMEALATPYRRPTFVGVGYPLRDDGIVALVDDARAINSGLHILLLTEPGERINQLAFGTRLRDLLFEEIQGVLPEISQRIAEAISRWEPRIVVMPWVGADNPGLTPAAQACNVQQAGEHAISVRFRWQMKMDLDNAWTFDERVTRQG